MTSGVRELARGLEPCARFPNPARTYRSNPSAASNMRVVVSASAIGEYWFAVADVPVGGADGADPMAELLARFDDWPETANSNRRPAQETTLDYAGGRA